MDKEKNDYHSLGIANVCYQDEKDRPLLNYEHRIISFISPLIHTLAKRHPDYTFVGRSATVRNDVCLWYNFFIYKGREHLGSVYQGYSSGDNTFCIQSPTTAKNSNRRVKTYTETKDIKKAAKLFSQHLVPAVDSAKLEKARANLNSHLATHTLEIERQTIRHRNNMWPRVMDIMASEWGTFAPKLLAVGADPGFVAEFLNVKESYQKGELLSAYATQNRGATILIQEDGSYLVEIYKPIPYSGRMSQDGMPSLMRTNLGMLKICLNGTVLSGVGVRYDERTFYVVTEEEGDQ